MHLSPTGAEQSQQKRAFLCSACQEWIFPGLSVLHDDASHILRPDPFLAITVTPLPWALLDLQMSFSSFWKRP